jgi:hypothetical protein
MLLGSRTSSAIAGVVCFYGRGYWMAQTMGLYLNHATPRLSGSAPLPTHPTLNQFRLA